MRVELWLSSLQRRNVGAAAAAAFDGWLSTVSKHSTSSSQHAALAREQLGLMEDACCLNGCEPHVHINRSGASC